MTLFIYTADINLFTADEEADMRALGMCRCVVANVLSLLHEI